jgi:hypothetical protein
MQARKVVLKLGRLFSSSEGCSQARMAPVHEKNKTDGPPDLTYAVWLPEPRLV